jgi:hypothetical protein
MGLGRLQPQYFQASGEATPQAQLPEQFVSNPVPPSGLSGHLNVAYESYHDIRRAPIVSRVPNMTGIWHLYKRFFTQMDIRRDGADGSPRPWNSAANRADMGPIRNGHFNNGLFMAGYPGYNLGLSFKVPTLPTTNAGTGMISSSPPLMQSPLARTPAVNRRYVGQGANQ